MHTIVNAKSLNPEFVALIASQTEPASPLDFSSCSASDVGQLVAYQAKFRANVEFYGRILMAFFQH
jgi:hypothetical protein